MARYFAESRAAFPDQRNELIALHHADDAVIVEFDLLGTHLGSLRGLPATGRAFTCRTLAIFEFEGEGIVCERVYFDSATILRQLGIAARSARRRSVPGDERAIGAARRIGRCSRSARTSSRSAPAAGPAGRTSPGQPGTRWRCGRAAGMVTSPPSVAGTVSSRAGLTGRRTTRGTPDSRGAKVRLRGSTDPAAGGGAGGRAGSCLLREGDTAAASAVSPSTSANSRIALRRCRHVDGIRRRRGVWTKRPTQVPPPWGR